MEFEQIKQIARNHCSQYGYYAELTGVFKELPGCILGESRLYIIGIDKAEVSLNEMGWTKESEAIYSKEGRTYHVYGALGYEELIRFMMNPQFYVANIPPFSYSSEYEYNNEYHYNILQYLLEFSLHYGIKFD